MCSCLDQLVCVLILLLQFHLLSSELGLEVIHLSPDEDQRARGQVLHRLGLIRLSFVKSLRESLALVSSESAPLLKPSG